VTDNIGYLTADDPRLRTPAGVPARCWMGCFAGLRAVALTSDGGVKGCLALPDGFREGNVRREPLERIWGDPARFAYNRAFDPARLSGACASCRLGPVCRGGCTALALAVHGVPNRSVHCLRLHGWAWRGRPLRTVAGSGRPRLTPSCSLVLSRPFR
jgi:radical SAM protein with 4Fe4S-binding SPASM domain